MRKDTNTLFTAAKNGDLDTVQNLISTVSVQPDEENWTVLGCAAEAGQMEVLRYLLSSENPKYKQILRHINAQWKMHGGSPLAWASKNGHKEAVTFLLDKGASYVDQYNRTPLIIATQHNCTEMVRYLLSPENPYQLEALQYLDAKLTTSEDTALLKALQENNAEIVELLIVAGAGLIPNKNNLTPQQLAQKKQSYCFDYS